MSWPARTICQCLEEMRNSFKTYNFGSIGGLIEEIQMLANRMEAHLDTEQTYEQKRIKLREIVEKIKKTEDELSKVKNDLKLTKKLQENK